MVGDIASGRRTAGLLGALVSEAVVTADHPVEIPAGVDQALEHSRGRRVAAESAAAAAESAAAGAAARAAAAIAAAARAAEEAEAAAEAAAQAAEEAAAAAAAERAAAQQAQQAQFARRMRQDNRESVPAPRVAFTPPGGAPQAYGQQPSGAHPVPDAGIRQPWPFSAEQDPDETVPSAGEATAVIAAVPAETTAIISAIAPGDIGPLTVPGTAAGGRAARRRAQEAAEAVAREATRDPETEIIPLAGQAAEPATTTITTTPPPPVATATARSDGPEDDGLPRKGRFNLRKLPPVVLVGTGVGVLIVVAAVLATSVEGPKTPSPAALQGPAAATSAPATPAPAASARHQAADPTSDKAVAYLGGLRNVGITTSKTGQAEVEAASLICEQTAQGAADDDLVKALPAVLPSVTKKQAPDVVRLAKKYYC